MCEMPRACRYPTRRRAFSKRKPALNCRRYVESGLALPFSDAKRSRHSEIPLVSGVNIAGLALMGLNRERTVLRRNAPTDLDAQIRHDVTWCASALLILPEQLKIDFWKIKELHPACQQPVN